jgi:ComEC/Rec2-related protein
VEKHPRIRRLMNWLAHMAMAQQGRLFLWLPVWLGVGVGVYYALPFEPASWLAALLAGVALLCVILAWRIAWLVPAAPLLLLPVGFVLFGFATAQFDTARKPRLVELPRRASQIEGNVQAVDLLPDGGRRLTLRDVRIGEDESLPRLLRIVMQPDDPVTPDVGDHVRTKALLQLPLPPSWPGGRDAQFESFYDGVGGSGRALGLVEDLGGGQIGLIAQLRRDIDARVVAELPGAEGGIATTLMAGAGGAISRQDRADFAASGLAHILAVAGLHLATVMGLVFGVVRLGLVLVPRWGLILPCKQIAAVASLLAGFGYMLLTGAHVPAERSFAMACLVVLAVLAGRRVISLRGLALAAMVVLLIAPDALVGVSFQMSFSAVLALIVGYRDSALVAADASYSGRQGLAVAAFCHAQRHQFFGGHGDVAFCGGQFRADSDLLCAGQSAGGAGYGGGGNADGGAGVAADAVRGVVSGAVGDGQRHCGDFMGGEDGGGMARRRVALAAHAGVGVDRGGERDRAVGVAGRPGALDRIAAVGGGDCVAVCGSESRFSVCPRCAGDGLA